LRCGARRWQARRTRPCRHDRGVLAQALRSQGHRRAVGARWRAACPPDPRRWARGRLALRHAQPRALRRVWRGGSFVHKCGDKRLTPCGKAVDACPFTVHRLDTERLPHPALARQYEFAVGLS
jgi:hypothetical protein